MTIRSYTSNPRFRRTTFYTPGEKGEHEGYLVDDGNIAWLATCDTEAEAEQAKRAFEQVLLPRFTRDEAIAIVRKRIASPAGVIQDGAFAAGARATLEALAAAGVFVDEPCDALCNPRTCRNNMADKLDAAGIK